MITISKRAISMTIKKNKNKGKTLDRCKIFLQVNKPQVKFIQRP
jgi:hypothetical protein